MKVLLRRNVPKLGGVGDVVNVASGYARNYLLPYGLAIEPTAANIKALDAEKQVRLAEEAKTRQELEALAERLKEVEVTLQARANEQGRLFGAVHAKEIVAALAEEGYVVQERAIELAEPIHQLDKYEIPIRLADDLVAEIAVWVVPEKTAAAAESPQEAESETVPVDAAEEGAGGPAPGSEA